MSQLTRQIPDSAIANPSSLAVVFHVRDPKLASTLQAAQGEISVLIKGCKAFTLVESEAEIPVGCVSTNVSPLLAVHLLLKGVIDVQAEMGKAEKKKAAALVSLDKLEAGAAAPDYATKKPEHVRKAEADKVSYVPSCGREGGSDSLRFLLQMAAIRIDIDSLAASIEGFLKLQ